MNDMSYNKTNAMSDKALIEVIGNFVKRNRLNQNKSQSYVAESAGISRSTLSLLERGEKVRIDSLIQVLRVLDLLHVLEVFKVEQDISPIEYAKLKRKERKQASSSRKAPESGEDLGW